MQGMQGNVLETLLQMQRFLDDNDATLDVVNKSGARKSLDDAVTQMNSHAVAQVGGRRTSKGETAKQRQLRLTLRSENMRPISVIAGRKLREKPEFTDLRLPAWDVRGPKLIAVARDMAVAAEKYTDLFVQEGLPSDFVAQLRAAADRLEQSIVDRGSGRTQRAGATKGLKAETTNARSIIRLIDSLVRPKLGTNDQLIGGWDAAIHIQRARTPASTTAGAQGSQPSATPSGSATTATPTGSTTTAAPSSTSTTTPAPVA